MYGCESWTIKKAEHWRTDAFKLWCWRRLLRVPLDSKGIKPVNPEGNQPWIFIGRTDAEAEAPILWLPDAKSRLTGKDPDVGKYWGQEDKRVTEDEMASPTQWTWVWVYSGSWWWRGGLAFCDSWGRRESEMSERPNWTECYKITFFSELSLFCFLKRIPGTTKI